MSRSKFPRSERSTNTGRLDRAKRTLQRAHYELDREIATLTDEGKQLDAERRSLDAGRHQYPVGAEALLHLLRSKLKGQREAKPLCELVEISNERWRDAVEGYLNTRRWDVLVAPEDFARALSLYERNKRSYPLPGRGSVFIANVGLVDLERVRGSAPRVSRRSLAEQVDTTDPLARMYLDFLLGDVICCDDEQELRQHRRAVTDTVMVYQNHVARQTPPDVYGRHYIGEAARVHRLDVITTRLGEIADAIAALGHAVTWLEEAERRAGAAAIDARALPDLVESGERVPHLRLQVETLDRTLAQIDRREIAELEAEKADLEDRRDTLLRDARKAAADAAAKRTQADGFQEQLVAAAAELVTAEARLAEVTASMDEERRAIVAQRYEQERASRPPAEIRVAFERQYRNIQSRVETLVQSLISYKQSYVNSFGFAGQAVGDGYAEFAEERETWQDSRLPEYESRISQAKQQAIQQLSEDIIFRLRENLVSIDRELREMNRALKDLPFGDERYEFIWKVAAEHRDFYDTIMTAGSFTSDSLFGTTAQENEEIRRTLQELFDRLLKAEAREVKTELERRADYREYFEYDLKIRHADGSYSLYDRVAGDKSGGETQTPYYIAIFASMHRLYRAQSPSGPPSCGLVLLDEAFAKMDERLIGATLRFGRDLGLQIILATPKERAEIVAPAVDCTKYIHKDARSGLPRVLDFTKELTNDGADPHGGAPRAPEHAAGEV